MATAFSVPRMSDSAAGLYSPNLLWALPPLAILSMAGAPVVGQFAIPRLAGPGNSVLLICNLNPESHTPEPLYSFWCVYGDVQRVKILLSKENALVQMVDGIQAQLAMIHLSGHKIHRKSLCITLSGAPEWAAAVQGPGGAGPHQGLFDVTPAPLQEARLQGLPVHLLTLRPLQHFALNIRG